MQQNGLLCLEIGKLWAGKKRDTFEKSLERRQPRNLQKQQNYMFRVENAWVHKLSHIRMLHVVVVLRCWYEFKFQIHIFPTNRNRFLRSSGFSFRCSAAHRLPTHSHAWLVCVVLKLFGKHKRYRNRKINNFMSFLLTSARSLHFNFKFWIFIPTKFDRRACAACSCSWNVNFFPKIDLVSHSS